MWGEVRKEAKEKCPLLPFLTPLLCFQNSSPSDLLHEIVLDMIQMLDKGRRERERGRKTKKEIEKKIKEIENY